MTCDVAIIGGGPAGLMAAEVLSAAGVPVDLYDAMPSVGRKFLLAGKGGMNLTHSEPADRFAGRYGERRQQIEALLADFGAAEVRAWALGLGIETFVGSSGRVFPTDMKAAPLLRAWLQRLRHPPGGGPGVRFHMRHRWLGWAGDGRTLRFETPSGEQPVEARAVLLALGGGSWARLGSNGAWVPLLAARGVAVAPLLPANCGFDVAGGWSEHFRSRFAGQPFKNVAIRCGTAQGTAFERQGEFVATQSGVEGSLVYAASALLRNQIIQEGHATLVLDLLPAWTAERVQREVTHPRGSRSLSSHLKSRLGLDGIKSAVLYERLGKDAMNDPVRLAEAIKSLPLSLVAARPIDEAISSAGGVLFEALDSGLMCEQLPGVFCAGEMLDWEAPTGGYLLTACLASGRRAGQGVLHWLRRNG
ncbi:TIGR03862 family flavoprotein [Hydrogenophaga pseudoflava]|uniref:TIGR03862 family flavoprotein n=1 Tax=Hydrogenophaga pseudoflava TaxID=47421 RepID=UPI0027E5B8BB|nr:TIGR03862 family flavoprotein [Hydrogenophaga pseudoflava]MDQ7744314.1 TIGR03862 family flavoprotein [Hydrogenophaga pseudoflava]